MARLVCYIDEDGFAVLCEKELRGEKEIDCSKCEFKDKRMEFLKEMKGGNKENGKGRN